MFVFLVAIGFGSSMLFTMIWDNHGHCIERGMMPDFTDKHNCIEFGTPQAFGTSEELISGFSSIDPPLSEITPRKPTDLKILFQYTSGPYAIDNLVPIIEITPESAAPFVQIETEPTEITQREIRRLSVKLTVDEQIQHEKIFLSISFAGNHFLSSSDVLYKSSWTESLTLDIAPKDVVGIALGDCEPIDIDYEISGGKTEVVCKSQQLNSVKAFVDANSNGTLTLDIPKHVLYALGSDDCRLDNDFFVLYDGEEIIADITGKESSNLVEVDFTSGIHEIEIIGAYIIPNPSPIQYCGIVENYDKLFLSPLDQTQRGMDSHQIKCNDDLVLIQKQNDTPACVKFSTGDKLIKRGWATCHDDTSYKRGHPCGPRSGAPISFDSYKIADVTNHPAIDEFYKKYPNAEEEIRNDHVSYVIENDDDYKVRMKLYFDENFNLDYIDFHCYHEKTLLYEVPEEDIIHYLENNECGNISSNLELVDVTHTVNANNKFAIDFYSQVSDSDENIFFSPWSISTAAAIVFEGARGNTADEMQQVFGYPTNDLQRQTEFQYVNSALNQKDENYKLYVANALWIQNGFLPHQEYVDVARNYYDSTVDNVDFNSDGADIINDWVSQNTQEKIRILFPPGPMPGVKLAITNAIYFNGTWAEPFDPELTVDAPFWINSQESIDVPMMRSKTQFLNYTETENLHVLQLPYQGDKLSMLILLPQQKDGINSLDDQLSAENLEEWKNSLRKSKVVVLMPKFEIETNYDLKPLLMSLGMNDAFGPADFSGMSSSPLFISAAVHKAFVSVNEKGTEAAAATGFTMAESAPQPINADHPFIFLIQDNTSGNILFIGRVMNPTG